MLEKQLVDRLDTALKNGEFLMFLQPKFSLDNKQIYGAEALVRWNHPTKGFLIPAAFLPIFERNGSIVLIDKFIFEKACAQIRWWLDNGYPVVPVSVNISRVNLYRDDFVEGYLEVLKQYDILPEYIELELTESAIIKNQHALYEITRKFKKHGISLSIDDFGNGFSCLSLLGIMPFDTVKIDKRFLLGNFNTKSGRIVIEKIVELVQAIKMNVVAEGVETNEQVDFLKNAGCNIVQGYLFSPPVDVDGFNQMMRSDYCQAHTL